MAPPGISTMGEILAVELGPGLVQPRTYGAGAYGGDLYGGALVWESWSCDVTTARITRGRDTTRVRNPTGVLELQAVDRHPAWTGTVQPAGRPIRVLAAGRPMFVGIVQAAEAELGPGGSSLWTITAVDDLARLASIVVEGLTRPVEMLSERITALLGLAGIQWAPVGGPSTSEYVQAITDSDRTLADQVGIALDSWRPGQSLLADRAGRVDLARSSAGVIAGAGGYSTWRTDKAPTGGNSLWVDLGCAIGAGVAWDVASVVNELSVANTGGTAHVYKDAASTSRYQRRTHQRHDLVAAQIPGAPGEIYNVDAGGPWDQWRAARADVHATLRSLEFDLWAFPPTGPNTVAANVFADVLGAVDVGHTLRQAKLPPDEAGVVWEIWPDDYPILGIAWDLAATTCLLTVAVEAQLLPV